MHSHIQSNQKEGCEDKKLKKNHYSIIRSNSLPHYPFSVYRIGMEVYKNITSINRSKRCNLPKIIPLKRGHEVKKVNTLNYTDFNSSNLSSKPHTLFLDENRPSKMGKFLKEPSPSPCAPPLMNIYAREGSPPTKVPILHKYPLLKGAFELWEKIEGFK